MGLGVTEMHCLWYHMEDVCVCVCVLEQKYHMLQGVSTDSIVRTGFLSLLSDLNGCDAYLTFDFRHDSG